MMNFSIFLTKKASGSGINKRKAEWSDTVIFESTKVFGSFIQKDGSIKVGILLWNENSHSNVSFTSCSLLANVKRAQEHNGSEEWEVLWICRSMRSNNSFWVDSWSIDPKKNTKHFITLKRWLSEKKGGFQKTKVDFRKKRWISEKKRWISGKKGGFPFNGGLKW